MNVCVIGNSHVGALKNAWDQMESSHRDIDLTFFAARGTAMRDLVIQDGELVPGSALLAESMRFTSNGVQAIVPHDYDAFLVYGLGAREMLVDPARGFSSAVLERTVQEHLDGVIAREVVRALRQLTTNKIFVGHRPMAAISGTEAKPAKTDEYMNGIGLLNRFGFSAMGAVLVPQPLNTIAGRRYTRPEFSKGSVTLAVGKRNDGRTHGEEDRMHMNAEFGAEWLAEFVDIVRSELSPLNAMSRNVA